MTAKRDIGAVLGRVDVNAERPLAERRVDHLDDRIGDRRASASGGTIAAMPS